MAKLDQDAGHVKSMILSRPSFCGSATAVLATNVQDVYHKAIVMRVDTCAAAVVVAVVLFCQDASMPTQSKQISAGEVLHNTTGKCGRTDSKPRRIPNQQ